VSAGAVTSIYAASASSADNSVGIEDWLIDVPIQVVVGIFYADTVVLALQAKPAKPRETDLCGMRSRFEKQTIHLSEKQIMTRKLYLGMAALVVFGMVSAAQAVEPVHVADVEQVSTLNISTQFASMQAELDSLRAQVQEISYGGGGQGDCGKCGSVGCGLDHNSGNCWHR
jgi:hypothetical protein